MSLCLRRLMVLAAAALASTVPLPALALDVCAELQSRLASIPDVDIRHGGAGADTSQIAQQNARLQEARANLRQLGCSTGSVTVYRTSNARECSAIASSVERIERELRSLEANLGERGAIGGYQEARARILAEIELYGCGDTDGLHSADANGRNEPITLNQPTDVPDDEFQSDGLATRYGVGTSGGRLRTVCVRTCDGGFFPITAGASPLDFRRDQRACARMCPQAETELYYQAIDSVDNGEMISTVTGRLYAQLPAAFAYRTRDPFKQQACSCNLSADQRQMRASGGNAIKENVGSVTTIRMRPVGNANAPAKVVVERPYDPEKDKVRNVGPVFLPDKEGTIDLRNPAGPN